MLSITQASKKLQISRSTINRWNKEGILLASDGKYSKKGIEAVAATIQGLTSAKIPRDKLQTIYDRAAKNDPDMKQTPSFTMPNEDVERLQSQVDANINLLEHYHAKVKVDRYGNRIVQPLLVTWVAYLQAKFGDALVADQDTGKLWLEDVSSDEYVLKELPPISSLLYDGSLNWGIDDSSTSNKKLEDAMEKIIDLVPQINPYAERLEALRQNWDGEPRLDTIFQDLLASPQDPEILKAIAHTWFFGAIHNWTRSNADLVFPMMLDINATAQGTGKSFFFNVINGIMTGVNGKADAAVDGDLNDPANIYPQLIGKAVVNDDEHRVYNASHPVGRQSSGSDINAAYKNWITLDTLEWMPKHSNQVRRVPVRYVLGRTSNISKPYNDNDTTEVDRRYLTVRGGEFSQITQKSVQEYVDYMKQVLGEAMEKFHFDSAKDANMSPELRDAMRVEQIMGSKQGDGWEFMTEIMSRPISNDFYAKPILDVQAYLAGTAPHLATAWRETTMSKNAKYVRPRAISGALFKLSQAIGTKTTKDQAEALTFKWLSINGFVEYDRHDFKWKGAHYQGDFMVNKDNDQYLEAQEVDEITPILEKIKGLNLLTTSNKQLLKNVQDITKDLNNLSEGAIADNPTEIQLIHETLNEALQSL